MCICSLHEIKCLCVQHKICHSPASRETYVILTYHYDIIGGMFLKYLQKIKKTQQHIPAYILNFNIVKSVPIGIYAIPRR